MELREMPNEAIMRIGEVSREEMLDGEYMIEPSADGLGLVARWEPFDPPRLSPAWSAAGIEYRINSWKPELDAGGVMAAIVSEQGKMLGFIVMSVLRRDKSVEVVAFFIDQAYRRAGFGHRLMAWAEEYALELGAKSMYVGSNPTSSAVNFYQKSGFHLVGLVDPELVRAQSFGLLMAKRIDLENEKA